MENELNNSKNYLNFYKKNFDETISTKLFSISLIDSVILDYKYLLIFGADF